MEVRIVAIYTDSFFSKAYDSPLFVLNISLNDNPGDNGLKLEKNEAL